LRFFCFCRVQGWCRQVRSVKQVDMMVFVGR
jgi:hypothetical protein